MDHKIFTWCVLAPASVALLGALACYWLDRSSIRNAETPASDANRTKGDSPKFSFSSAIISLAWWLAICIGINSTTTFTLWPDDAWPKIAWPMLAAVLLISPRFKPAWRLTGDENTDIDQAGTWVLIALLAIAAAALAMPTGDGWNDMLPLHQPWIAAVATASISNSWLLYRLSQHNADRWLPLVLLAGLASPTLIGAAAYGALAQVCVAAIAATTVIAIFAGTGMLLVPSALIVPCALFTATMIAAGRFYSYTEISPIDYGVALFTPSIIALVDRIFMERTTPLRIVIAATIGSCLVGYVAYRFLLS